MALHSHIPESALTAGLLGTDRRGHAIQINAEGLLLTAGYSVLEANEVWLTNSQGRSSAAIVLAQDYDSGIALLKPMQPLGQTFIDTAPLNSLSIGGDATVITSNATPMSATVFAIEEFVGRWEYLLDEAIYTVPLCEQWSGAGLLNADGKLVGIGSLALGLSSGEGDIIPGNLFIPTELIMPHVNYLREHGEMPGARRPWLGLLTEEQDSELQVMGVYHDAPAANAGIRPGDVILSVGSEPVSSMPGFFRSLWHYGPAGSNIPLTLKAGDGSREVVLKTIDRNVFFSQHEAGPLN